MKRFIVLTGVFLFMSSFSFFDCVDTAFDAMDEAGAAGHSDKMISYVGNMTYAACVNGLEIDWNFQ